MRVYMGVMCVISSGCVLKDLIKISECQISENISSKTKTRTVWPNEFLYPTFVSLSFSFCVYVCVCVRVCVCLCMCE